MLASDLTFLTPKQPQRQAAAITSGHTMGSLAIGPARAEMRSQWGTVGAHPVGRQT